ncbi:hypothetical protein GCM10022600_24420 [Qipengyuania pelagi]|uniref:DUF3253 domain-containing protein n=1 Tax=Qipengyuania pelagi TaxID=994320 RepID=A0A844Y5B3_9SPHN|nr:DUF3253 domain-containing protein [Qipengyuania pelagi]MXO52719.1 DUF3253 domain-containing protein [Qipengyuania pelagi]
MACATPRSAIQALLDERKRGASICPSEAARILARDGEDWRKSMPIVHAAVDEMIGEAIVTISWKGQGLRTREGPYRISLTTNASDEP